MQPTGNYSQGGNSQVKLDWFLVCGLGGLGQHCVKALKEFGVKVIAIENIQPSSWEIDNLEQLLDELVIGDCRQSTVLEQAKIKKCRAALIVTSNEQTNAETALAIRQLNPLTRLVVRSSKENLNQLLSEQLGNFIAYEPTQLPASSFALAALGSETQGFFSIDGQKLKVIKRQLKPGDRWCRINSLQELNSSSRRIVAHLTPTCSLSLSFHQWDADLVPMPGDTLLYVEITDQFFSQSKSEKNYSASRKPSLLTKVVKIISSLKINFKQQISEFWGLHFQQQVKRVAIFSGIAVLILLIIGTILFAQYYPETTLIASFYTSAILLLGGYADLFADFQNTAPIPGWLQLFALGLTLVGTAFVGVLYALLTEALLSSQFHFINRRPAIPQQDHVIIIGLGRIGQRVTALLQEFQQSVVGVTFSPDFDKTILPTMPLIIGSLSDALSKANFTTAKSIVVVTDDEMLNLEIALTAHKLNPHSHLVIRTQGTGLCDRFSGILPNAVVVGAYGVGAEAFAGAAFGENILGLCRLHNQTMLLTEYYIEVDDTLNGLLLSEIAYGYEVLVILHQKLPNSSVFMPSEDVKLAISDRLVLLASIEGLRRIEKGLLNLSAKCWRVQIEKFLTKDALFEGANIISRISGCSLELARDLIKNLPQTLPMPLYKPQAQRLIRELNKAFIKASIQ